MNYRDLSPRGDEGPQRERQRPDPKQRHGAFARQRGGSETTVSEADRERARAWHRDEWEKLSRERKLFIVEMLDKYGGHRASKLLGYAIQTLYAVRAELRRKSPRETYGGDGFPDEPVEDE